MVKTKLLVIGAGGHGQSIAEAAELTGQFEVVDFVNDALALGTSVLSYPVLGFALLFNGLYQCLPPSFCGHWKQRFACWFG